MRRFMCKELGNNGQSLSVCCYVYVLGNSYGL